ncbi:MAG: hypothetical protein A3E61_00190 [Candidatus Colwellbacteria bacterium RIFCSPHIGHO2_12_FULL_43_12]|uniref:Uncharacterized protein n=3 Tax=Candidatus Colwelliibacteriota TaxID=1817904 RepID=A0A1G1YZY3_9BACT|nr:MAG: hypothetical protein A3D47_02495 [Candidatus Colwellbacteria bacterium RIFCSPHIGHO2_02_FULL_43_15]OGY58462.1 MAG: hypothetical protein A3E61_00190 [Candidatus Colwellbacteria bacterium RIFCSPHIGHO2_12_FULL_43_12]OGY61173.1 MAG: hypothetical protein A3F99_00745 [Candidatus Colwellbacteria bacterium RIFCSPLOWO2_12_FULL_43_11]
MKFIKSIFNIRDSKKKLLYIILLTFLLSFIVARIWSIYYGHSIYIRGFHIHHFYFGMLLLSVGGILGILSKTKEYLQAASLLIGAGIGLFADEIGLLLNCTTTKRVCEYAFPGTYDIIISISAIILISIVATSFVGKNSDSN